METLNLRASDFSWSSIPTDWLRAELSKRDDVDSRPQCGSGKRGEYDTGLHVFALFLILLLSTVACGFPIVSRRLTKGGKRQKTLIFLCQHFGTGVLMATAFVHLLPTAFNSLTDPCLPYAFSKGYKPLAGLIAMVSALVVVALESYLTTRGAGHSHSHNIWEDESVDERDGLASNLHEEVFSSSRAHEHRPANIALHDVGSSDGLVAGASPLPGGTPRVQTPRDAGMKERGVDLGDDPDRASFDLELTLDELGANGHDDLDLQTQPLNQQSFCAKPRSQPQPSAQIPNAEEQKRLLLQCVLLEAGILFHSIFIGMALSVATGPTFAVFLTAIAFHQSFEGLALGTRIAAIHFPKSSLRPWLMVVAFGTTTPIGQAIGLFIHQFYDPMSQMGLLMVGFMNAISSGLLLFAGLVQLLAEDFLAEKSYTTLRGRRRVSAFLAVVGGAGLMSAVGAFA
ncbi:Zinc/iron permease [Lasiosphaeria miniovina]|uniref:Zinc/iron permease n=1 Tax=Lasiosphaeria miniovina TaxID=1954250 RepID=A0AA40ECS4_9PEZI|nr:Zinc/iron permease [Lasiosphaeria miniovina]KAK0735245.1 Zinc/iron permease [Lasiosphaeria miniovina]